MYTTPSWMNLTPTQSKELWLDYMVKTHGCTRRQAEDAFDNNKTPREAETEIKIAMASTAVKKYRMTLPTIDEDFMGMPGVVYTKNFTWEPECTCDSKLLFDQGCQCEYAEWKKERV